MDAQYEDYDVAIIGGGAAGLGAATTLARSLRRVVVIDAGEPRNAPAAGAHNLLGREGINPLELLATGRQEALGYGAEFIDGTVVSAQRHTDGFRLGLADGTGIGARRIILATGLVDELPEIPGLREHWGSRVLHCPYCHGWEVRGKEIGILATTPMSAHGTLLFRQLSDRVTVFLQPGVEFEDEIWDQLAALDVQVVEGRMLRLQEAAGDGEAQLEAVIAGEREMTFRMDALAVAPRFRSRGDLYQQLGGTLSEHPMGEVIPAGMMGVTDLPGVWAAGNAGDLKATVSVAHGAGVEAGGAVNADLVAEDARQAVLARRG